MEDNKDTKVEQEVEKEETTKTYTKEDLDNSFNAGVRKANSDWQKDEKYKEFLEWKKTNQNDSEKLVELQTSNEQLLKENKLLKFVTSEVMTQTNETTSFENALKNYKKENPQYFGEIVIKKVQSSPNLTGGVPKETTTNDIMNSILRGEN